MVHKKNEIFEFSNLSFINNSNYLQNISKSIFFSKTNIVYDITPKKSIEYSNKNILNSEIIMSDFTINESVYKGMQKDKTGYTDNKLTYTYRANDNKLIQLSTKFLINTLYQNFDTKDYQFSTITNNSQTYHNSKQTLDNFNNLFGLEFYSLNKLKNGNTLELLFTNQINKGNPI